MIHFVARENLDLHESFHSSIDKRGWDHVNVLADDAPYLEGHGEAIRTIGLIQREALWDIARPD